MKTIRNDLSIEELYRFSNKEIMRPIQVRYEILRLLEILKEKKPKVILEIGTDRGGSLFLFSRIAPTDAHIISVSFGYCPRWRKSLFRSFISENQKFNFIEGDSHSEETLEKVKKVLDGKKIDFLFIDGDHRYEGVKKDFEIYSQLVSDDGIIGFHDIAGYKDVPADIEVDKFWNEIKNRHKHEEIVENWGQGCGIGLIKMSKTNK